MFGGGERDMLPIASEIFAPGMRRESVLFLSIQYYLEKKSGLSSGNVAW